MSRRALQATQAQEPEQTKRAAMCIEPCAEASLEWLDPLLAVLAKATQPTQSTATSKAVVTRAHAPTVPGASPTTSWEPLYRRAKIEIWAGYQGGPDAIQDVTPLGQAELKWQRG